MIHIRSLNTLKLVLTSWYLAYHEFVNVWHCRTRAAKHQNRSFSFWSKYETWNFAHG